MEAIRFHRRIPPSLASQIILPEVKVSLIQSFERIYESVVKAHGVYQLEGEEGDRPSAPWLFARCLHPGVFSSRCFPPATLTSGDWICWKGEHSTGVQLTFDSCFNNAPQLGCRQFDTSNLQPGSRRCQTSRLRIKRIHRMGCLKRSNKTKKQKTSVSFQNGF